MGEEYVIVDKSDLEIIANSVRDKTNSTDKYSINQLANAMANTIVPPVPTDNPKNKYLVTNENGIVEWADLSTDEQIIETMLELDAFPIVQDTDGTILIDSDNSILLT